MALRMLALLALFLLPCVAHNWMITPSRMRSQASTTAPCAQRKSTDLHAQVGPNQQFAMKFASGHMGDFSYVVVIRGEDEEMLGRASFLNDVNDYLDNAPSYLGGNTWKRYHDTTEANSYYASSPLFTSSPIDPGNSKYIDHPVYSTTTLWEYENNVLLEDLRAEYTSSAYPWIVSAGKFKHLAHLPKDADAIRVRVPSSAGTGHFIVHWRWKGYYDCMDVDVRPSAVTNLYGTDNGDFIWNKVDHCQYINPIQIWTRILEAENDAYPCINALPLRGQGRTGSRFGVNVIPVQNPSTVAPNWRNHVNLPWRELMRDGTSYPWDGPIPTGPADMYYCVGIKPRVPTETEPEYVISDDPSSPIFYSTCLVRERNIVFDHPPEAPTVVPRWRFNGMALRCDDYHTNKLLGPDSTLVPKWHFETSNPVNCDL